MKAGCHSAQVSTPAFRASLEFTCTNNVKKLHCKIKSNVCHPSKLGENKIKILKLSQKIFWCIINRQNVLVYKPLSFSFSTYSRNITLFWSNNMEIAFELVKNQLSLNYKSHLYGFQLKCSLIKLRAIFGGNDLTFIQLKANESAKTLIQLK